MAKRLSTVYDGETAPASVAAGVDNNGTNGDGADEDALVILPTINSGGGAITIPVTITAPAVRVCFFYR